MLKEKRYSQGCYQTSILQRQCKIVEIYIKILKNYYCVYLVVLEFMGMRKRLQNRKQTVGF